jgi:cell wall assembly regulator SMI1
MPATAETVWRVPAYLPYLQPELTAALIRQAESRIGFRLPPEYLALLRAQNGGYIRYGLPESPHSMIYGIGPYFPSITNFDWEEVEERVSFELKGLVPFDGDGHWHICLDYRNSPDEPSVTYVDVECDRESPIADSFGAYLRRLAIDAEDGDFVLPAVTDVETVKSRIEGSLGVKFEPPSSSAHGYPIHRARCTSGAPPEWIWISPNLVPRGFVREDDPRYAHLRDLLPGMARRYPELPEPCYLLGVTEGMRPRVIDALKSASVKVRPLAEMVN